MADSDKERRDIDPARRRFLTNTLRTAVGVGLVAVTLGVYQRQARALPADAIRPPGAREEPAFQGACIRCGLCVRDCPFDMLYLGEVGQNIPTGTPYFIARDKACFTDEARSFGIDPPRGLMLVGISGCGKTQISLCAASELGIPLIQFDVGCMMSKWVGESERSP